MSHRRAALVADTDPFTLGTPLDDVPAVNDALALLADEPAPRITPPPQPSRAMPARQTRTQRAPNTAPRGVSSSVPRGSADASNRGGSARRGRDAGRDPLLSEYLASLGRYALLDAEDERRLAAAFRDAELACWRAVLTSPALAADVLEHRIFAEATPEHQALVRSALGSPAQVERAFEVLREIDDDRSGIEEILARCRGRLAASPARGLERIEVAASLSDADRARHRALDVRNQFVRANLRLVVSVARRFRHHRLPLIDLVQEGNIGLIKSVHRFDHTRGFRFSTYAHWWIRQAIERAIMNKGAQVRLPVHVFDARRELARATRDLQANLGREPTTAELARALHVPPARVEEIRRTVPREPVSLDELIGDDEDRTLGELLADPDALSPDEHVASVHEQREVRRVLAKLTPTEVDILRRRFGLDVHEDETLEDIGRSYNLSRERVRQLQVQGLRKLKEIMESRSRPG